ncbi:hypothetical protein quinque_011555 [Culex quinquefasciatus]
MSSNSKEPFRLPAPKFQDETNRSLDSFTKLRNPHFSTPSGMLLPRDKQPPPMYGPRGSTVPPRFLNQNQRGRGGGYHNNQQRFRGPPPQRGGHNYNQGSSGGFERDVVPELLQINWALWCEKCDFNSRTEEELARHCAEHRGCDVEGCTFVGHPGVMKRHWRLVHDEQRQQEKAQTDTKQSPEEIDAWREQRRKRYPTKENVERRQQAQEERFSRGERIEEDKRRFANRNQQQQEPPREGSGGGPRNFRNEGGRGRKKFRQRKINGPTEESEENGEDEGRVGFKGTSGLKDYKEKVKTALSLLTGYGSDSGETSSEQEEEPPAEEKVDIKDDPGLSEGEITEQDSATINPESLHISEEEEDGEIESVPEVEQTPEKEQTEDQPPTTDEKSGNRRNRNRKRKNQTKPEDQPKPVKVVKPLLDYSKLRYARQNTMLEKLLDKDIRHERNVLLQCVRFVVDNKFFGIGQPKEEQPIVESSNKDV